MSSTKASQIIEMLEHSRFMLKNAQEGRWDQVIEGETLRRHLIQSFFSEPTVVHDVTDVVKATREMLTMNDELKKLTAHARDLANQEMDNISTGRRAVSAYNQAVA